MGEPGSPRIVKLFVGMLSQDISLFEVLKEEFQVLFGPSDLESPVWPWDYTNYYAQEMGSGLKRKFVFFEKLIYPGLIADIKVKTCELEKQHLYEQGGRRINLDPGYLDPGKIVLVSTKDFSHRIYLGKGIYGEVTLVFSGKTYQNLPHTYPDFRTNEYRDTFKKARALYMSVMREHAEKA